MKKVGRKIRQTLSFILAAAMIITCVPQTAFSVMAAENEQMVDSGETASLTDDTRTEVSQNENEESDADVNGSTDAGQDDADEEESDDASEDKDAGEGTSSEDGDGEQQDHSEDEGKDDGQQTPSEDEETDNGQETPTEGEDADIEGEEPSEEIDGGEEIPSEDIDDEQELSGIGMGLLDEVSPVTESREVKVVVIGEGAEVDCSETAEENQEYTFTVKAKTGYTVEDVKVYKSDEYNESNPGSPIATTEQDLGDGKGTQYTITAEMMNSDITIVVATKAGEEGADEDPSAEEYTVELNFVGNARMKLGLFRYAIGDSTSFKSCLNTINVPKGQSLKLKTSKITRGYIAALYDANKGYENGKIGEILSTDSVFTIESVTSNMTINVEAVERTYLVTEDQGNATNVKITYSGIVKNTSGDPAEKRVYANSSLIFAVSTINGEFDRNTDRIERVAYQCAGGPQVELEVPEARWSGGRFTIPASNITGDITIYVETGKIPTHKISFLFDTVRVEVKGGAASTDKDLITPEEPQEIKEGKSEKLYFTPKLIDDGAKYFMITAVTATIDGTNTENRVTQTESGKYILRNVTEDMTVKISIALDETKCNNLILEADGHDDAFTVSIEGFVGGDELVDEDNDEERNNIYVAGDKVLTQSSQLTATVNVNDGYQIDKVELDGVEQVPVDDKKGPYTIEFESNSRNPKPKTLKVYTTPKALEADEEKTVTFSKDNTFKGDLDTQLKVTTNGYIVKQSGEDFTYDIKTGATYFDFELTVDGSEYDPVVIYKSKNADDETGTLLDPRSNDGNTYTYSMAANRLPDDAQIIIGEKAVNQTVKVYYDSDEIVIASARIGLKEIEENSVKGGKEYQIPRGYTVTFNARALDYCRIISVVTNMGGEEKTERPSGDTNHSFSITVTENVDVNIESGSSYRARPVQEVGGGELTPVGGVYNVSCYKEYSMGLLYGVNTPVHFDLAEVKIGGKLVYGNEDEESEDDIGLNIDERGDELTLGMTAAVAGKTISVALYLLEYDDEGENAKKTRLASYTLKVGSALTSVKVDGVSNGQLSQTINTEKSYKLTANPASADVSGVEVEVSEASISNAVKAELSGNELKLTTCETADETATVILYMSDDSDSGRKELAEFTVTTVNQLDGKQPDVSLKFASDTSLTLTLSAPKGIEMPTEDRGYLYYKVEATPQDAPAGSVKPDSAKGGTGYFKLTGETSQNVTIKVNDIESGRGYKWSYDVTVTLIQTKGIIDETSSNEETVGIGWSEPFKTPQNKPFETKTPYYEDNLKLKKGTTTVYTGQENIIVATPQFGKNTTFTEITARDLTYGEKKGALKIGNADSEGAFGDGKTDNDGNVIVSAIPVIDKDGTATNNQTALGKHTIEVVAYAPKLMYASRATIVVTVVRGVESLQVSVPSVSMYKAGKKAATLKATVQYNTALDVTDGKPKAKKVAWDIVKADTNEPIKGSGSRLDGMVTIKNGTVTVNKNYVLSAKDDENTFRIKVTAADYKGSSVTTYSAPILITDEKMSIGSTAVVRATDDGGAIVIAKDKNPEKGLEAEALQGTEVKTFVKGAPLKDVGKIYTKEEIAQYTIKDSVSYKSSNAKAVSVDNDGNIKVLKPAKKVKLTVTANDGSKEKTEMTLTEVKYDSVKELGLYVEKYNVNTGDYGVVKGYEPYAKTVSFTDTTAARFRLTIRQKVGEKWEPITNCTNYKLKVTGAKIVPQVDASIGVVEIVANSKEAKITLTNNSVDADNTPVEYKLANNGFETANSVAAPSVSLSGSLIASSEDVPTQTVAGQLKGSNEGYTGDAEIEVDWTKATAKNRANLEALEQQMNPKNVVKVENGKFELNFYRGEDDQYYSLNAGSYKLKVTLGKMATDYGPFTPSTKPASVTLRVVKPKAASFKMTTSYTIAAKDQGYAILKGKCKNDVVVTFHDLMNANVKGEGQPNSFRDYFELDEENGTLCLNNQWKDEALFTLIDGKHLTGYVSYTAKIYANPDAANRDEDPANIISEVHGTVKITVKVQKNNKLKYTLAANKNVQTAKDSTVVLTAKTGKNPVKVAYAVIDKESREEWDIDADGDIVKAINGSEITLKSKTAKDPKKYAVYLYIVPKDSYYEAIIADAIKDAESDTQNDLDIDKLIVEHGIKVKSTITAKD